MKKGVLEAGSKKTAIKHLTTLECMEKAYDIDDPRTRKLQYLIDEMLTLDNEGKSMIEIQGFYGLKKQP